MSNRTPLTVAHFKALKFRKLADGIKMREVHLNHLMLVYLELEPDTRLSGTAGEERIATLIEGSLSGHAGGERFAIGPGEAVLIGKNDGFEYRAVERCKLVEARGAVDPAATIRID